MLQPISSAGGKTTPFSHHGAHWLLGGSLLNIVQKAAFLSQGSPVSARHQAVRTGLGASGSRKTNTTRAAHTK